MYQNGLPHYNDEPLPAKACVVNFELGGSCQEGGQPLSLLPVQTTPHYHHPLHQYVRTKVWGAPPIARYPPGTQRGDLS